MYFFHRNDGKRTEAYLNWLLFIAEMSIFECSGYKPVKSQLRRVFASSSRRSVRAASGRLVRAASGRLVRATSGCLVIILLA